MEWSKGKLLMSFNNLMHMISERDIDGVAKILHAQPQYLLENCMTPYTKKAFRPPNSPLGYRCGETPFHAASSVSICNKDSLLIFEMLIKTSDENGYNVSELLAKTNSNGYDVLQLVINALNATRFGFPPPVYFVAVAKIIITSLVDGRSDEKVLLIIHQSYVITNLIASFI